MSAEPRTATVTVLLDDDRFVILGPSLAHASLVTPDVDHAARAVVSLLADMGMPTDDDGRDAVFVETRRAIEDMGLAPGAQYTNDFVWRDLRTADAAA